MNVDQCFHDRDNVIPAHGSLSFHGEYLPCELIGDVAVFQNPGVIGLIEPEIQGLHMIRALSAKPVLRDRGFPCPFTFTFLGTSAQALIPA